MNRILSRTILCPYCSQSIEILIDPSVTHQDYVEDCEVCCRPISLHVTVDNDEINVNASSEND